MSHDIVTVEGRIWGIFAHRFAIETAEGKVLADLGPDSIGRIALQEGDRVSLSGERKRSEIKVGSLVTPDGTEHRIARPDKHPHENDADPALALGAARAAGYETTGVPRRKPKHWEVDATRDGHRHVLHVELDGKIRGTKVLAD